MKRCNSICLLLVSILFLFALGCKKVTKEEIVYVTIQRSWITHIQCPDSMKLGETQEIVVSFMGVDYYDATPDHIDMRQMGEDTIELKAYFKYKGRIGRCLSYGYQYQYDTTNPIFKLSIPYHPKTKGHKRFLNVAFNKTTHCIVY